jgi:ribose-phosphate pyrophosphokinase
MTTIETVPALAKIEFTSFVFSGGEVQVRITNPISVTDAGALRITANLTDSNKIMELAMLVDAIRRINSTIKLNLVCPYFPYARQDRACADGEALAVKVMADFINGLNFENVEVADCHSDVGLALINHVYNVGPEHFLESVLGNGKASNYVLVSPDAGAMKKVAKVAKKYNCPMLVGGKNRNPITGEITGSYVNYDPVVVGDRKLLIVDDICAGGRTFIELAKAIKLVRTQNNKIELYVTHGTFEKGIDIIVDAGISTIYVANPFPNVDLTNPYLTVVRK